MGDVHIHDLRRTLGSWLAASGYSLPLIGRALNHTQVSTTAIYARLNLDPVREALEHNAVLMLSAGLQTSSEAPKRIARPPKVSPTIAALAPSQTFNRGWVELFREELYEKLWSQPAISLAEEFGISDRGLGKICARFDIPSAPWLLAETLRRPATKESAAPTSQNRHDQQIQIRRTPTKTNAAVSLATS